MSSNKAAFVLSPKERPLAVRDAPMPAPGPDDVLIRLAAVAINPCDVATASMGIIIQSYPSTLGVDGAGTVEAVGSAVTTFKPGDRVCAMFDCLSHPDGFHASFQHYALAQATVVARVPDNVKFEDAAVLPLGMATAAAGVFEESALNLPLPSLSPVEKDEVVLVWGAASSVGTCATQLIRAAGYQVAAVASKHNHQYCRDLGALYVFDYKEDNVEDAIVGALKGKTCAGVFEAPATDATLLQCARVASKLNGRRFVTTANPGPPFKELPAGLPDNVAVAPMNSTLIRGSRVGIAVFEEWIPKALASGQLKCKPDKLVVGKGLEAVQEALDRWAAGVSAQKVVVSLP